MEDDVLTRNSSDELALRVTQSSGDTGTNKEDVYTRDSQGRLAVRTVGVSGGGGGASTNLNVSDSNLALMSGAISGYTYNGRNRVIIGTCVFSESLLGQAHKPDNIIIGNYSTSSIGQNSICIAALNGTATSKFSIAIGSDSKVVADYAIQLGEGTNSDANTFKVGNNNGNFEMMDANGNVPLDRLTYVTNQIGDISTALTAILGE